MRILPLTHMMMWVQAILSSRLVADGRRIRDENQNACQTSVMKINFTVPTFSVFRVDEIEFLSQLDENKLRKWEREQHESGNYRARFPARLSGLRLQVD
ncbi:MULTISPECIES: hypothetical protein [unclassified Rhizobium]